MLRYLLLSLLADGRPAHGYALMKAYTERTGLRISIGNVYREVQRMAAEGLITTAPRAIGADTRRAPYTITVQGRCALAEWLRSPTQAAARNGLDELSARLAAVGDLEPAEAAALLDEMRTELWAEAKAVERDRAELSGRHGDSGRIFPIHQTLLTRRAIQLAGDIELVNQLSACLGEPGERAATATARTEPPVGSSRGLRRMASAEETLPRLGLPADRRSKTTSSI